MHSRAYLLLKRDLANLQRFPMDGVSACPCSDLNMFQWQARLQGLPGTPWEGGMFHLRLLFNAEFNMSPPVVQFMTIPFHPNIDPADGTPHCHLLAGGWNEIISVPVLLIALQALLSSPELDTAHIANSSASELLQRAPHTYHQMAMDCVSASLRIDAGLAPYEEHEVAAVSITPSPVLPPLSAPPHRQPHCISFNDYFSLWRGIATSRPHNGKTIYTQASRETRSRQTNTQLKLQQHHILQHGQGGKQSDQLSHSLARLRRIDQLRLTYCAETGGEGGEEEEVDQLLQWTTALDGTILSTPHSLTTPL